ncbi:hypothetical protein CRG98_029706 [Punica granatum]|uniref:Uncharacterized protein n=1 Tax=Punica granatum TaxID=22663 RepID=A0A2I0J119_PUNGR|nr:hypothetical protein CRG98_029706 [Punica granatum]
MTLSAPHFGPPASYTRTPCRRPGYYSSPGNKRHTCGHRVMNNRRRAGSTRKAEEGGVLLKPGHPDLSRTPFLTGLREADLLTSKRHPKTGLQALRDLGVVEQASDDLSELYRAPRGTFQW